MFLGLGFATATASECKKFKWLLLPLSVLMTQPAFIEWQSTNHRSPPAFQILAQKAKSNHYGDSTSHQLVRRSHTDVCISDYTNGCICLWGNFTSQDDFSPHELNQWGHLTKTGAMILVHLFVKCWKVISRVRNKYVHYSVQLALADPRVQGMEH